MNPHPSRLLAAVAIALAAGCAGAPPSPAARARSPAAAATPDGADPRTALISAPRGPEAALEKGMTAEMVRRVMGGAPAEILPMRTAAGTAEIWVYRRTTQGSVRQVQVGTKSIPIAWATGTDGQQRVLQSIDEPILRMQTEIFDETVQLLVFGGRFLEQKRSVQRRLAYQ